MLSLAFLTQRIKGQGSCLSAVQALTQANLWQSMAVVPEQGQTLSCLCALGSPSALQGNWTLCASDKAQLGFELSVLCGGTV